MWPPPEGGCLDAAALAALEPHIPRASECTGREEQALAAAATLLRVGVAPDCLGSPSVPKLLRVLRNAVAGCPAAQLAAAHNAPLLRVLQRCVLESASPEAAAAAMQAAGNITVSSEPGQEALWGAWFPDGLVAPLLRLVLSSSSRSRRAA